MASISISPIIYPQTNPSLNYLPFNKNGVFKDSLLLQPDNNTIAVLNPDGNDNGLFVNNATNSYFFGDYQGYQSTNCIILRSNGNADLFQNNLNIYINQLDGGISIFNDLITSSTAGLLATYLKLSVNGVKYKIALLNDTI